MDREITLITKDGQSFKTTSKIGNMIGLVGDALEMNEKEEEIVLPEVDSVILYDILSFCARHKYIDPPNIPKPLPDSDLSKI